MHGMCRKCYLETRKTGTAHHRPCVVCHVLSEIYANGMCRKCHRKLPKVKANRKLVASQRHRPCVVCHIPSEIYAFDMCRNCYRKTPQVKAQENRYKVEYNQRPTTKARKKLYSKQPRNNEKRRDEAQRYNHKPEVKARRRAGGQNYQKWYEWQKAHRNRIGKCAGCGEVKKIQHTALSLCRHCNETRKWNLKYGSRANYRKITAAKAAEYRKTPKYKEYYARVKSAEPKPWSKCGTPTAIQIRGMCGKCWQQVYHKRPGFKEQQKVWTQRYGQKQKEKRRRESIRECVRCHVTTEICQRGMCKGCYDDYVKERKKFYNERWMQKPGVMEKRKLTAERYNRGQKT